MQTETSSTDGPFTRYLLSRAPGVLFALAALLVSFSGAALPALETEEVAPPPVPNVADGGHMADVVAAEEAAAPATGPVEEPVQEAMSLTFTTGDRLDADQRAEYDAYIAALKAKGQHRGPAYYSSW